MSVCVWLLTTDKRTTFLSFKLSVVTGCFLLHFPSSVSSQGERERAVNLQLFTCRMITYPVFSIANPVTLSPFATFTHASSPSCFFFLLFSPGCSVDLVHLFSLSLNFYPSIYFLTEFDDFPINLHLGFSPLFFVLVIEVSFDNGVQLLSEEFTRRFIVCRK